MTPYAELKVKEYKIWDCTEEQFNKACQVVIDLIQDEIVKCIEEIAFNASVANKELFNAIEKRTYYEKTVANLFLDLFNCLSQYLNYHFEVYTPSPNIGVSFKDITIDKSYINLLLQEFLVKVNCMFDEHNIYDTTNKDVKLFYIKPQLIMKHDHEITFNEPTIDLSNFKED